MEARGHPISKKVLFAYAFDWIVIILIAIVGGLFSLISPNHRAFNLANPDISYPFTVHETISTLTLTMVSFFSPAVIILLVCLIFVPGPTVSKAVPKALVWRRKLWEWNTAWMGLGLALASVFMITDGMKSLFGKPRPDLLSRCNPDVANIDQYKVGGLGSEVLQGIYLVSWDICRQPDLALLKDGFASFPSGHSSFSWAGLGYLTLFLCSKFAITIPYLLPGTYTSSAFPSHASSSAPVPASATGSKDAITLPPANAPLSQTKVLRSQAAAPPIFLLLLVFVPIGTAIYICSTRYADYRHHGFDIIFGSLLGMICAWGSFRWYHAPIRQGAGWSWGPRSADKAWGIGLGVQGYSGPGWKREDEDVERGHGGMAGSSEETRVHSPAPQLAEGHETNVNTA